MRFQRAAQQIRARALNTLLSILVLLAFALFACACTSPAGTAIHTTGSTAVSLTLPLPTGTTVAPPTTHPESKKYLDMLKQTYDATSALSRTLESRGASVTDPDAATIYALRARAQAITARRAMADENYELADGSTQQLRKLLTQAQTIGQPPVLEIIETALATSADIAEPSIRPQEAAAVLDAVINDLAPLLDEAAAASGS